MPTKVTFGLKFLSLLPPLAGKYFPAFLAITFQLLFLAKIPNTFWTKFGNSSHSVQWPKANHILLMNARKMECNQEFSSNAVTHR